MKRSVIISISLITTIIAIQGYRVIESAGLLYAIKPHFSGQCEAVSGIVGAEDITIDRANHYAYISADDRRLNMKSPQVDGGIYGLDLTNPEASPVLLYRGSSASFHPHGISLYQGALYQGVKGTKSLFVINHLNNGEQQVEVLDVKAVDELVFRTSISYPDLITPNDLVAIGPSQFYATNDHGYLRGSFMQTIEDYLGLPLSTVTYYDGNKGSIVASGLRYGNGITVSADLKTLYVAQVTGRKISVFDRNSNTGGLIKRSEIPVNSGPDNLEWDDVGNLWLGGHPRLLDFVAHAKDSAKKSPSQVIKIDVSSAQPVVSEIYLSAGNDISGSTVAAASGGVMLIGSVFEDRILKCKL